MTDHSVSCETYELEVAVDSTPERVWKAIVNEASSWWPKDFVTSERTRQFVIEPVLGGRAFEDFGSGDGLVWYTVIGIDKGRELVLAGHLLPPFGGPATTALRISVIGAGSRTIVKIRDDRFGVLGAESPVEGWRLVFDSGLRNYLEPRGLD